MKTHLSFFLTLLTCFSLVTLSTGSSVFLVLTILLILVLITDFISVLWASGTLSVSVGRPDSLIHRGDQVNLTLSVRHRGRLPVAPVLLDLVIPFSHSEKEIRLKDLPGRRQVLNLPVRASHVGAFTIGIRSVTVEDLFSLFEKTIIPDQSLFSLTVLPLTFDTEPLTLAPGDPGSDVVAQATEDLNAPSDIRAYQPGDAMKKIHWKLSLRKGELIVRKFDEPILQDVLILLDCSSPPSWDHPQAEADIRDSLIETAASVFTAEYRTEHGIHLPLQGNHPLDLDKSMGLPLAMANLAQLDFSAADRFERVLSLESRRLRKVGCVAVISARLNPAMVDIMIRMHRMGPDMRLYLITFVPDDPALLPLIARLRHTGIEVSYVTPAPS